MTMKRKYLLTATAVLFAVSTAYAKVTIHGKITDPENEPVEFVTVRIGGTAIATNSGLDGSYSLSTAEQDTIEVIFTCIGFKEVKRQLIDASEDVTLNIGMQRNVKELQEVEVTEFRKQTGAMQTIEGSSYKLSPDVS
ncbi:MAG: carboxypeptidase-like regulatory domain-containing protein, partial [Clostridia bacterium]|nr:carboxypeptidase-like regulatory domain-containing protein [Clostridia bacterium]